MRALAPASFLLLAALLTATAARGQALDCTGLQRPAAGGDQSFALGLDDPGDLGLFAVSGWGAAAGGAAARPRFVPDGGAPLRALRVAAGSSFACVRLPDGRVLAWGSNSHGQLGRNEPGLLESEEPRPVQWADGSELGGVVELSAGARHALARLEDGTLVAWGDGEQGQLGDGMSGPGHRRDAATLVLDQDGLAPLMPVHRVAGGDRHSLAIAGPQSLVLAWGANDAGQAGHGQPSSALPLPVVPPPGESIFQADALAAGRAHSLARTGLTVHAWGAGNFGQLGQGTRTGSARPLPVLDESGASPLSVTQIEAGDDHSIARRNGELFAWGRGADGRLGTGDELDRLLPAPMLGVDGLPVTDAELFAAGRAHSLCTRLSRAGVVTAWGANGAGQLGAGDAGPALAARLVARPGAGEPSPVDRDPGAEPLRVRRSGDALSLTWQGGTAERFEVVAGTLSALRGGGFDDVVVAESADPPVVVEGVAAGAWLLARGACLTERSSAGRDSDGVERELGTADPDRDGDGVANVFDLCPDVADPEQGDVDGDGIGDACDDDTPRPDARLLAGGAVTSPEAGGVIVRVEGSDLADGDGLRFASSGGFGFAEACEVDGAEAPTALSAVVPRYFTPGGPFPDDVDVLATRGALVDGDSAVREAGGSFTYYANPTILAAAAPDGGELVQPGDFVTVTGVNLRPEADDFVGSVEIANSGLLAGRLPAEEAHVLPFVVLSNNVLQFEFPTVGVEDYWDVTIRTPRAGASCTQDYRFTLLRALVWARPPELTGLSPASGPHLGGTEVILEGVFSTEVTQVRIDGVVQPILRQDETTVTIVTQGVPPSAAGFARSVAATGVGGDSNVLLGAFTYELECVAPLATGLDPASGEQGDGVAIEGSDLIGLDEADPVVTFGGSRALVDRPVSTADRLVVIVPPGPAGATVAVEVGTCGGTVSAGSFTYDCTPPRIATMTPYQGRAGTEVRLGGTGLLGEDGLPPTVLFGSEPAAVDLMASTPEELVVTAPPGVGVVVVRVQTCGGTFDYTLRPFTYCNAPTLNAVTPASGPPGTVVEVGGILLISPDGSPAEVFFGAEQATVLASPPPTAVALHVEAPAGAGTVDVRVETCGGPATLPGAYTYP